MKNTRRFFVSAAISIMMAALAFLPTAAHAAPADGGVPNMVIPTPLGAVLWDAVEGPDGRLYVSDAGQFRLFVYPLDADENTEPVATFTIRDFTNEYTAKPHDLFFDESGNLWLTTGADTGVMSVDTSQLMNITGEHTVFADEVVYYVGAHAFGVTVHGNYMYATTSETHFVDVIDLSGPALYARVFSPEMIEPAGVTIVGDQLVVTDNSDSVRDRGSVISFALGDIEGQVTNGPADLTLTPTARIVGENTQLSFSDYTVADCAGNFIVTNYTDPYGAGVITKFASGATGDVEPIVAASANDFFAAEGISIDSKNRVWVTTTGPVGLLRFDSLATSCAPQLPDTGIDGTATWAALAGALTLMATGIVIVRNRRRLG